MAGCLAAILPCFAEQHCTNTPSPARKNRACWFQLPPCARLPAYQASSTSLLSFFFPCLSLKWYHPGPTREHGVLPVFFSKVYPFFLLRAEGNENVRAVRDRSSAVKLNTPRERPVLLLLPPPPPLVLQLC